jgi:hypothetical protein
MERRTAHLALYDGAAAVEVGHPSASCTGGRFTGTSLGKAGPRSPVQVAREDRD